MSTPPTAHSSKQIRPKVRSRAAKTLQPSSGNDNNENFSPEATRLDQDAPEVEEIRQRMEAWMGFGRSTKQDETSRILSMSDISAKRKEASAATSEEIPQPQKANSSVAASKPAAKSILKNPKYTKKNADTDTTVTSNELPQPEQSSAQDATNEKDDENNDSSSRAICKDVVVERDPTKPMFKRKVKPRAGSSQSQSHSAVEGYVPTAASLPPALAATQNGSSVAFTSIGENAKQTIEDSSAPQKKATSDTGESEAPPLILNSLEELFQAAGEQLPLQHDPHKITEEAQLLEADISFSVMTQDQYDGKLSELKEQHEEERQAQLRIFLGTENIFEDDDADDDDGHNSEEDDDHEDDLLEMLMGESDEENDDYFNDDADDQEVERQPRVFRLLWDTLSEWMTAEAAQYISHLTSVAASADDDVAPQPWRSHAIERSDVEASRCAGLMAMVKLYLPKSLEELGYPSELRRTADQRLGEFLRMFCYVQQAPKLPVKLWKAMTCILLEIVMVEHGGKDGGDEKPMVIPPSVANVGMTLEEYRYLGRSAMQTFCCFS